MATLRNAAFSASCESVRKSVQFAGRAAQSLAITAFPRSSASRTASESPSYSEARM